MAADRAIFQGSGVLDERQFEGDFRRPVLILTVGRSGSSMVAHIFREHGLWLGSTRGGDTFNPHGYFENDGIKERMKKFYGFDVSGPMPETKPEWVGMVREIMRKQGYPGGKWGLKTGVHYWNVWRDFDPIFVKIMRHRDEIEASYQKYGGVYRDHGSKFIDRGLAKLRELEGYEIDAGALVTGRRDQIRDAVEAAGFPYSEGIVDTIVNPDYWHDR